MNPDKESPVEGVPDLPPEAIAAAVAAIRSFDYELWEARTEEESAALVLVIYRALKEWV